MDTNIIFKIYKDTISISEIKKDVNEKDLNNTNIIDVKDLKFSKTYIKENFELVSSFLNVVVIKKNIINAVIGSLEIADIAVDLINTLDNIKSINFKQDKKIPLNIYLKLYDNKSITNINVYELDSYLIDRMDLNKNILITTRNPISSLSDLMKNNFLKSYSDIYYKKELIVDVDLIDDNLNDFKNFIVINNRLKNIRLAKFTNENLAIIIKELKINKKENINVELFEKDNNIDNIIKTASYFKRNEHDFIENNKIKFKINYSKNYIKMNLLRQINYKMIVTLFVVTIILSLILVLIKNYRIIVDSKKISNEISELNDIRKNANDNITTTITDIISTNITHETTTATTTKYVNTSSYYEDYSKVFEELKKINSETVGWITLNNTTIDYPVVQHKNNSYYLNYDFYKKKNSMGWVFMDYRNNSKNLDQNTIIYGHNVKNGLMFGELKTVIRSSWYKKKDNQIITFNTPSATMKWKIFSIYKIDNTIDYLENKFETSEDYQTFLNLITNRSIYDFNVEVTTNDKILTLSTCWNEQKMAVHAVLLN